MALPLANIARRARWPLIAALLALGGAAVLSYWSDALYYPILGGQRAWASAIRHQLIDWGLPTKFVTGYVSFVLYHVPQWTIVAALTFCLGIARNRRAHEFAWVFSGAVPTADILIAMLRSGPYGIFDSPLLLSLRVYCLIPMCGALVGVAAWWAGYLLRGHRGRGMGCCTACGYDLRGAESPTCPECGHMAKTPAIARPKPSAG